MPLVVRRRSASLRALQCFGFGTTREEENQGECRDRERADGPPLVNTWPGVCAPQRRPLSAPAGDWQLLVGGGGQSSAQEWQGSEGAGHILAPERTNSNTSSFKELHIFLKQERGYIFLLFSSFCLSLSLLEVLVLSLRKSFWGINTYWRNFLVCFPFVFFFP